MGEWPALELQFPDAPDPDLIELVQARLDDFQPTAIQEDEPRTWRVFFAAGNVRDAAETAVTVSFSNRGVSVRPVDVDDENWAARSQVRLRAVEIGRLIVAPPWDLPFDSPQGGPFDSAQERPFDSIRRPFDSPQGGPFDSAPGRPRAAPPGRLTIVIEPSTGFGTGHHASTRLCLKVAQAIDLRECRVLDIGTGSGLLAIAAILLGASHACAVDFDADALDSARENAELNQVAGQIRFEQADFRNASLPQADIVFANLTGSILLATLDRMIDLAVPNGLLILSGFTSEELIARPDGPAARSPRVEIIDQRDEEGWRCLVLRRR